MRTRVQRRVLYGESAQVRLGEARGRFRDKKIRVGAAYQAVIPVLQAGNIGEELATVAMARDAVCEECSGPNYGGKVTELPPGVCAEPGADGHLLEGAKQAAKCTSCRSDAGYCTKLGVAGHLTPPDTLRECLAAPLSPGST